MVKEVVVGKSKILFWHLLRKTTKHNYTTWSIPWLTNCPPPEYMSEALSLEPSCLALNEQKRGIQCEW
jgi:hypothetical protein